MFPTQHEKILTKFVNALQIYANHSNNSSSQLCMELCFIYDGILPTSQLHKKNQSRFKKWNPYLSVFHFDLIYFCSIVLIHILFKKINITFLLFNQLFNHIPKIEATIETIRVKGCMADFDSGISGPPRLSSSRFIGSI